MTASVPYLTVVVEHYKRPRNHRSLAAPTHVHEGVNPLCGDRLRMEVQVLDGMQEAIHCAAGGIRTKVTVGVLLGRRLLREDWRG